MIMGQEFSPSYLGFIIGFPFSTATATGGIGPGIAIGNDLAQLCDPIIYFISTPALNFVMRRSPPVISLRKSKKKNKNNFLAH